MAENAAASGPLPVVPYLKIPEDGDPYLEGQQCTHCQKIFLTKRTACANCGTSGPFEPKRLANTGTLYVYSIVHRSFPGIEVPYVSSIVDLDGGGTGKGNLIGIDPDASLPHPRGDFIRATPGTDEGMTSGRRLTELV